MSKTRFAIVGLGNIAEVHAKAIDELDNAELYAICTSNRDKGIELCDKYKVRMLYHDIDLMLAQKEIDVVCILIPSGLHSDIGIKVAKAGKHVIVEKPIDISLEKADELIEACRVNDVRLGVISQHRMDKSTIRVKKAVENGQLGSLVVGSAHIKWFRSQEYYDSGVWRGTWELDGGGALMNQGIHTIDLLLYIMGDVKSVSAICKIVGHERIEVEDIAVATVEFENGAVGTIVGSTVVYPGLPARLEISGTEGTAIIEGDNLVYMNSTDKDLDTIIDSSDCKTGASNPTDIDYRPHMLQLREIVEAIRKDSPILCDGLQGRRALELILAIYKSSRENKIVYLG